MKNWTRPWRMGLFFALAIIPLLPLASCTTQQVEARHGKETANTKRTSAPVRCSVEPGLRFPHDPREKISHAMQLCVPSEAMTIPGLLHCIRLDGIDAVANNSQDETVLTKQEILDRVLNHSSFKRAYQSERAYLVPTANGARFSEIPWSPTQLDVDTREAHWGQTLSILAEIGIPSTEPIQTSRGASTLQAVIDDSVANFTYDVEPYWVTSALAMYLAPQSEWTNKFGHHFSFSDVAERLMSKPPAESGPCGGTHTLNTLAVLLQVHEQHQILKPDVATSVRQYLASATVELEESQASDGSWSSLWTRQRREEDERKFSVHLAKNSGHYVWMTGHHLEWQALLPPEMRVPRERFLAAATFVLRHTQSREAVIRDTCRYSHGIRAIQLLLEEDS